MSVNFTPDSSYSSSMDPMQTISSPSSDIQTGMGVPQYLFLLRFQSRASRNQLANLPSLIMSGTQYVLALLSKSFCCMCWTLMNQLGTALNSRGVSDLQQ